MSPMTSVAGLPRPPKRTRRRRSGSRYTLFSWIGNPSAVRFSKSLGFAALAVVLVTVAPAHADDAVTTTTRVPRSSTTVAEPVIPTSTTEPPAPEDPDEQVATEEAPPYVGPALPRIDLTQSTFDPRAQSAFATYAAARKQLDDAKAAIAEHQAVVVQANAAVTAAEAQVEAARERQRERSQAMRSLAVRSYISDQGVQLPEDGRGAFYGRLARKMMRDGFARDQRVIDARLADVDAARRQAELAAVGVNSDDTTVPQLESRVDALDAALRLYAVGVTGVPVGFRFPVAAKHAFGDSWGAPRMVGTKFQHSHEGTDVFAAFGSPLVAVEDGIVQKVGKDTLGGMKLWLVGSHSGNRYYYAHLSAFSPGLVDGTYVTAGQIVGQVGDSGNAKGGAAHLHFEIHPNGYAAVNPYPLLRVSNT